MYLIFSERQEAGVVEYACLCAAVNIGFRTVTTVLIVGRFRLFRQLVALNLHLVPA